MHAMMHFTYMPLLRRNKNDMRSSNFKREATRQAKQEMMQMVRTKFFDRLSLCRLKSLDGVLSRGKTAELAANEMSAKAVGRLVATIRAIENNQNCFGFNIWLFCSSQIL